MGATRGPRASRHPCPRAVRRAAFPGVARSGKSFARAPPRVARNPSPPPRPGGRRAAARTGGRHARPAVGGSATADCALASRVSLRVSGPGPRRLDTLECQTLKVREPVRRSFVTDLAEFRHQEGFVTRTIVVNLRTIPDIAVRYRDIESPKREGYRRAPYAHRALLLEGQVMQVPRSVAPLPRNHPRRNCFANSLHPFFSKLIFPIRSIVLIHVLKVMCENPLFPVQETQCRFRENTHPSDLEG